MNEGFLKIHRISFGPGGKYDLEYTVAGDSRVNREEAIDFGDETKYGVLSEFDKEAETRWAILNNGERFTLPRPCESCGPTEQHVYWRTFTEQSMHNFQGNGRTGEWFNEAQTRQLKGYKIIEREQLDKPGVIWLGDKPGLSLSVGLSRRLIDDEPVVLMAFNICGCCLDNGMQMFKVIDSTSDHCFYVIKEATKQTVGQETWRGETVVNQIPTGIFDSRTAYEVDPTIFLPIREALLNGIRKTDIGDALRIQVSKIISGMLSNLALKDPEARSLLRGGHPLPRTYKLFLKQII